MTTSCLNIQGLVFRNQRNLQQELLFTRRWKECRTFTPWRVPLLGVMLDQLQANIWLLTCLKRLVMMFVERYWFIAIFMCHQSLQNYHTSKVFWHVKKLKKRKRTKRYLKRMDHKISQMPFWMSSIMTSPFYIRILTHPLAVNQLLVRTTCKQKSL